MNKEVGISKHDMSRLIAHEKEKSSRSSPSTEPVNVEWDEKIVNEDNHYTQYTFHYTPGVNSLSENLARWRTELATMRIIHYAYQIACNGNVDTFFGCKFENFLQTLKKTAKTVKDNTATFYEDN